MVDVDYFKRYNDDYGHLSGDGCLREISNVLKGQTFRASDLAYRIGGEEFCLVLPNTNKAGVIEVADRIRSTLEKKAIPHRQSPFEQVTLSMGMVTSFYESKSNANSLIRLADRQLYLAKEAGRNTYKHIGQE